MTVKKFIRELLKSDGSISLMRFSGLLLFGFVFPVCLATCIYLINTGKADANVVIPSLFGFLGIIFGTGGIAKGIQSVAEHLKKG